MTDNNALAENNIMFGGVRRLNRDYYGKHTCTKRRLEPCLTCRDNDALEAHYGLGYDDIDLDDFYYREDYE